MSDITRSVNTNDQDTNQYYPHVIPGYNYLEALHPDVAKCLIYDHDRKDNRSIEMCDWKCPDCQGIYTAFIQDIIFYAEKGKNTCPYCNETQVFPAYNSLKARHPEVAKLWSPRNRKAADQVLPKSTEQALWICSDCYNEYDATILAMTSGEMQCPYCTGWRTLPGVDSFSVKHLDIVELWSSRNRRRASEVHPESTTEFFWNCPECHGEFKSTIQGMMSGETECPYCSNRRVLPGYNSLAAKYPEIAKLWSSHNVKTADEVLYNSHEIAMWTCPECHGEFTASVQHMLSYEEECPYCNDRRVLAGYNSLAAKYPDVAKLWSSRNIKSAVEVLYNSKAAALWICQECKGEYSSSIRSMTTGEIDCPYCNDRKVLSGYNSLDIKYPDVAKLWSAKNIKKAADVLYKSDAPALWVCPECKGEFTSSTRSMTVGEMDCPYCNDRKVLPGFNSFAVRHADLLAEWDYVNNYILADPDQILDSCTTPVWWTCSKNMNHEYTMTPANRVLYQKRRKKSCPYCKGLRRKKRHFI